MSRKPTGHTTKTISVSIPRILALRLEKQSALLKRSPSSIITELIGNHVAPLPHEEMLEEEMLRAMPKWWGEPKGDSRISTTKKEGSKCL